MDRRETYKLVSELLPRAGSAAALLDRAADLMRGDAEPGWETLNPVLSQDDALGRIYQALNAPALEAAYRGTARDRRKFTSAEIPAVTQLFTPRWVVEFLLQNTLGKLWIESHPDSALRSKWTWMVAPSVTRDASPKSDLQAQHLRICDPACGTMNFGLVAIDILRDIYREEEPSREIADIDASILRNNLFGFDIDPTAIDLARQSIELKMGRKLAANAHRLAVCDALHDRACEGPFDVVVTNPPYLSARNLDPRVVRKLKSRYPTAWRDLYACFILRALEMLRPGGRAGVLAMQSFMFTSAFEPMRRRLHEQSNIETVAHFGPGLFDVGNPGTLQTVALALGRKPTDDHRVTFFRLIDSDDKRLALQNAIASNDGIELTQQELASSPRGAWMYWIVPAVRHAFVALPKLGNIAPPRQGLATTDNDRFVRYWWEIEPPGYSGPRPKWKPYAKGGRFRRWHEAARHRVNWKDDGREIKQAIVDRYPYLNGQWQWVAKNTAWYGRAGITYSYLTSGSFSARRLETGAIFDVAGSSLFPEDSLAVLGILNSSAARQFLSAINPTVNFQVGDLRQLPMPSSYPDELRNEVSKAIEATQKLDSFDETSIDFVSPADWHQHQTQDLLLAIENSERAIDRIAADLYAIELPADAPKPAFFRDKSDLARRWISYALGIWLGRWGNFRRGDIASLLPLDASLSADLQNSLMELVGESATQEIIAEVGGLDRFFARDFSPWHNRLYRDRPVFWCFGNAEKLLAVSSLNADANVLHRAMATIGASLPAGWNRWIDDGIRANLAPLRQWIAHRKLRNDLGEIESDLAEGRLNFSQTARWLSGITAAAVTPESNCVSGRVPRRKQAARPQPSVVP